MALVCLVSLVHQTNANENIKVETKRIEPTRVKAQDMDLKMTTSTQKLSAEEVKIHPVGDFQSKA